jgi:hypothetical protein
MKGNVMDPWKIAEKAVKELPPYLGKDELTAERLYKQHPGELSNVDDARKLLDRLVEAGELRSEERRNTKNGKAKGGSKVTAYLTVEKGK